MGRYCSYLLPKQAGGIPQIKVNPTEVCQEMCHPVITKIFNPVITIRIIYLRSGILKRQRTDHLQSQPWPPTCWLGRCRTSWTSGHTRRQCAIRPHQRWCSRRLAHTAINTNDSGLISRHIQSGASVLSQGFEDNVLGSSPG